ncbi:response regulator [Rossellomorea sp. H39__3]
MIKLLIVDDEPMEREGMQLILEKHFPDLVIQQAKNGRVAVDMAATFSPDLVLMDIKMPGMNGLEAIEAITAEQPHIKFIMVTAYDTFSYMKAAIKLGRRTTS